MKRLILLPILLLCAVSLFGVVFAAEGDVTELNRVYLSEDGSELIAEATLAPGFIEGNRAVYLFRVSPENESIETLTPIAITDADKRSIRFTLPYDVSDASLALYGYRLALVDEVGEYQVISPAVYLSNFADFAPHTQSYPAMTSKKGLQVQLLTDAQLLGVKHTTVTVFFNELIAYSEEKAITFLYGGNKYYVNSTAVSALDYRIRSLSDAGIHIYLNCLLAFDTTASSDLYYDAAVGNSGTLFAPNVSTREGVLRYAAMLHFLASRYSDPTSANGFCGSFILGYEANEEGDRNSAGIPRLDDYAAAYATFLRIADTAVRSAYANARVFVPLSNRYHITQENEKPYLFCAYDFLTAVVTRCSDLPFGIAVNPYPSVLTQTDFWNDPAALDKPDASYITMKNLSVLIECLQADPYRYQGTVRPLLLSEFGVSGESGTANERLQAAAYLYAYKIALQHDTVEALIWHRHVDHAAESSLYYGLYASSDLLLEPSTPKAIHAVFKAVDRENNTDLITPYLSLLPENTISPEDFASHRVEITVSPIKPTILTSKETIEVLYDFSKSLYDFYPTDNTEYLELCEEEDATFLRAALLRVSSFEHMGIGATVPDLTRLGHADSLTLTVRVVSKSKTADLRLLFIGNQNGHEIVWNAEATVDTNEWLTITFPLNELESMALSSAKLRLWTRTGSGAEDQYLDVKTITLGKTKTIAPLFTLFLLLVTIAVAVGFLLIVFVLLVRFRRRRLPSAGARASRRKTIPPDTAHTEPHPNETEPRA
ncbi:MAG: hypothetical protein E7618_02235 [Ruminococcaceae bacterium]|nr:hypothetical protein [Oscillospiraceae bacterium]